MRMSRANSLSFVGISGLVVDEGVRFRVVSVLGLSVFWECEVEDNERLFSWNEFL